MIHQLYDIFITVKNCYIIGIKHLPVMFSNISRFFTYYFFKDIILFLLYFFTSGKMEIYISGYIEILFNTGNQIFVINNVYNRIIPVAGTAKILKQFPFYIIIQRYFIQTDCQYIFLPVLLTKFITADCSCKIVNCKGNIP